MIWRVLFFVGCFLPLLAGGGDPRFGNPNVVIPHLTRPDGGFMTRLIIENPNAIPAMMEIWGYTEAGQQLQFQFISFEPGEIRAFDVKDLFFNDELISHIGITARPPLGFSDVPVLAKASAVYTFAEGGIPAQVPALVRKSPSWRFFPGNWERGFDGLAIINMGTIETSVMLHQYDFDGNLLQTEVIAEELGAFAKALYVVGSPGNTPFEAIEDTYFELTADHNIAVTVLRGDTTQALWAVPVENTDPLPPEILSLELDKTTAAPDESFNLNIDQNGGEYMVFVVKPKAAQGSNPPGCQFFSTFSGLEAPEFLSFSFTGPGSWEIDVTVVGPGGEAVETIEVQVLEP